MLGAMRDLELYTAVLGIASPWMIRDASLDIAQQKVEISVTHEGPATCPICGRTATKYDTRSRRWRHLDFCQYQLFITAEVPRIDCDLHGVKQIAVPWAEERRIYRALLGDAVTPQTLHQAR